MDKVVHFEIPYDNLQKAKEFYSRVFGWEVEETPEMKYHICRTGEVDKNNMIKEKGVINGGMYNRADGGSKHPVIVIDVQDIDDYIIKVQQAGGAIFSPKRKIGEMGYYAQIRDTEGNIIGIWETVKKG